LPESKGVAKESKFLHCKKKVLSGTSKKGSVDYKKFANVLKVPKTNKKKLGTFKGSYRVPR
jgi:hypothetical protein